MAYELQSISRNRGDSYERRYLILQARKATKYVFGMHEEASHSSGELRGVIDWTFKSLGFPFCTSELSLRSKL